MAASGNGLSRPFLIVIAALAVAGVTLIMVSLTTGRGHVPSREDVVKAARAVVPPSISDVTAILGSGCDEEPGPPAACYRTASTAREAVSDLNEAMSRGGFANVHSSCIRAKLGGPHAIACEVRAQRSGYRVRFGFGAETPTSPAFGELFVSKRRQPSSK